LNVGEGYGHLAVASPTIYETCDTIKREGGKVTREPGPVKGGTTEIAFVEAPGGWKVK
jgi:lactoylglutathione lyase